MRDAARIASVIEVLEKAEEKKSNIDTVLTQYFKHRRYAGGKDRAAVRVRVYRIVRNRLKLEWWLGKSINVTGSARLLTLADIAFSDRLQLNEVELLFDGSKNAPASLADEHQKIYQSLVGNEILNKEMPKWVRLECPEWVIKRLDPILGEQLEKCVAALNEEAPFDLRLNTKNSLERGNIQKLLQKLKIESELTPYSPIGLRVNERRRITHTKYYKRGLLEVQDEGAQVAALLVDAKPGMQVADFCCGAGGKTLVMAGLMKNSGRILALDTVKVRLEQAGTRIKRAGLHNVERKQIKNEDDPKLKRLAKKFDRVLVDAPCTGIGTWRRDPDTRRKYNEQDLENIVELQSRILTAAARLTKPGGRLVYVTCSLLPEENEQQIERFLLRRKDYSILPIEQIWNETILFMGGSSCEVGGDVLRLDPHKYGTDGFFVAVLERSIENFQ